MRVFGQALAKLSDEELLARLLGGDAAAFETLYERRQSGVYRFALRMSGSTELAEDVVQDVFLELMRDGHQFDAARGTVAGYLFGMAHHRVPRGFAAWGEPERVDHPARRVAIVVAKRPHEDVPAPIHRLFECPHKVSLL